MASALKRLFRIQYVSDLHLEFLTELTPQSIVKPAAPYLALAGDIVPPSHPLATPFFDYVSANWQKVFYVAGNHEYYAKSPARLWAKKPPVPMFETQKRIQSILQPYHNIHYLHHDAPAVYLPEENVAVIGTTLWTHIPDVLKDTAQSAMNDYTLIPVREEDGSLSPLDPETTNILHAKERAVLHAQIEYWAAKRAQVAVITHHMPSFDFISPRFEGHPLNVCFASSCEDLMHPPVRAWIYGHTHNCSTAIVGNTICVVNAHGYPSEKVPGFRTDAWVEFPTCESECAIEYDEMIAAASGVKPYMPRVKKSGTAEDEEVEFF
jgi:predicted phosphodiesterase